MHADGEGGRRSRWPGWPGSPKLRRRAIWIGATGAALAATLWFGLPAAIGYGIEAWLREHGATSAEVGDVELGLWSARVRIDRIDTAVDDARLALRGLDATFDLSALFGGHVLLREIALADVYATVTRTDDGRWRIGGLAPDTRATAASSGGRWAFGVRALDLRNARLAVNAYGLSETLTIQRLRLSNLVSWEAIAPLTVEADLGFGKATLGARGSVQAFRDDQAATLEIEARALPLATFAPLVQGTGLKQLAGQARIKAVFTAQRGEAGPRLSVAGAIGFDGVQARASDHAIALDGVEWSGKAWVALGPDFALAGDVSGMLSVAQLEVRNDQTVLDIDGFESEINWNVKRSAGQSVINVSGHGKAGSKEAAVSSATAGALQVDALRWNGRVDIVADPGRILYAYLDGALALNRSRGRGAAGSAAATSAAWQGWVSASRAGSKNDSGLTARGTIRAADLVLRPGTGGVEAQAKSASWQGQIELETADNDPELHGTADARVSLEQVVIDDTDNALRLFAADRMVTSGLFAALAGGTFVNDLDVQNVQALARLDGENGRAAAPLIAARSLFVDQVGHTADGVRIGEVSMADVAVTLVRERDGGVRGLEALLTQSNAGTWQDNAKTTGLPIVAAGPLRVEGQSSLRATDRTMRRPVRAEIVPFTLEVGRIDRMRPHSDTAVQFRGTMKPHGQLAIAGTVRPFAPETSLALAGKLGSLDLAPFSPYLEKHLGLSIETGQLTGGADVKIRDGIINGVITADAHRLDVKLRDPKAAAALTAALPVSFDTALDLLRDERNRIRVTVPVSGNISDPQFDLDDTVNRAVGRAVANAVETTLKVLFPIGALAAAVLDNSDDGALRFQPLRFAAGDSAVDPEAQKYQVDVRTPACPRQPLRHGDGD